MQLSLQDVLARSTSLSPNRSIRIDVVGQVVVLRGMVPTEHDRRLAESLIRLTPGVRDVRNQLQTLEALPPP
jgi:osmotically-inducible protein OsmY